MHPCEGSRSRQIGSIYVALPMGTHNHTALSILKTSTQDGVLIFRSHFCQCQRSAPPMSSMSRGIRTIVAKVVFIVKLARNMFVFTDKRTYTHVLSLRLAGRFVARLTCPLHETPNGRSLLLADGHAQRLAKHRSHAGCAIERFPTGLLSAWCATHRFPP